MAHFCVSNPCAICHPKQEIASAEHSLVEIKVNAGVAVILVDPDARVLMGKRKGSHGAGTWSFPGGWINTTDSSVFAAAKREVFEETGITLIDCSIVDATLTHFIDKSSVTILLSAHEYEGVAQAKEKEKIDGEWHWFRLDELPEPLFEPLLNSAYIKKLILPKDR